MHEIEQVVSKFRRAAAKGVSIALNSPLRRVRSEIIVSKQALMRQALMRLTIAISVSLLLRQIPRYDQLLFTEPVRCTRAAVNSLLVTPNRTFPSQAFSMVLID